MSITHILILAVILLVFFGPSRLPSLGRSIGEAIRGFKKGMSGDETDTRDVTGSAKADQLKDKENDKS